MKQTRNVLRIYGFALSAVTLLVILLRCLDLFLFYDRGIGYYQSGAILPIMETALLFAFPVALIVAGILWLRHQPVTYAKESPRLLRLSALLASIFALVFTVLGFMENGGALSLSARLLPISAIIGAVYFLLSAGKGETPLLPRVLTGVGLILFFLLSLGNSYFDVSVGMNTPDKLLFLVACLSGMLFTVEELQILVGKEKRGLYFFSLGAAVFFLGASSIPTLVAVSFGAMYFSPWHLTHLVLLGVFLYALTRMLLLVFPAPDAKEIPATEAEESAIAEEDPTPEADAPVTEPTDPSEESMDSEKE